MRASGEVQDCDEWKRIKPVAKNSEESGLHRVESLQCSLMHVVEDRDGSADSEYCAPQPATAREFVKPGSSDDNSVSGWADETDGVESVGQLRLR